MACDWRGNVSEANPARRKTPAVAGQVDCWVRPRAALKVHASNDARTRGLTLLTAYGATALPARLGCPLALHGTDEAPNCLMAPATND